MRPILLLASLLLAYPLMAMADVVSCGCDPAKPESLQARQCALCREAEKQPADVPVFFLKDINATKPNRWLTLLRIHDRYLDTVPADVRAQLWSKAVAQAKTLFPDEWAIAYNSPTVQTQCHVHVHLGKLIQGVETDNFITVTKLEDIPVPVKGEGIWIHPQGNLFHVHLGEQITETVLLR